MELDQWQFVVEVYDPDASDDQMAIYVDDMDNPAGAVPVVAMLFFNSSGCHLVVDESHLQDPDTEDTATDVFDSDFDSALDTAPASPPGDRRTVYCGPHSLARARRRHRTTYRPGSSGVVR